jgi:hypothetical protein
MDYCDDPHLDDPSTLQIGKTWNGLAILIQLNERAHDPQTELLREFLRQHEDSELVLVPTGGYSNYPGGASLGYFEIRKAHTPKRPWWRRILG